VTARRWLGLDIGTSSTKALVVDDRGVVVARGHASYGMRSSAAGHAEQRPEAYLDGVRGAIADCGAGALPVAGIGLAGQTPTLVLVDEDGRAVRPALTWQDTRAAAEAQELERELGASERLFGTELPWAPAYPPAKLLWLARHEPEAVEATAWALQPKDYVGLHLTGSPLSDPWSSKGISHLDGPPAAEALVRVGWPTRIAPPIAPAWALRGHVSDRAAEAFGLAAGTPVAVGWSDALAGMLAAGAFEDETGFVLTGTSSIVGISTRDASAGDARLLAIPTSCAPLRVVYGPTQAGGSSIEWLARLYGSDVAHVLELAARATASELPPPAFVPYLAGERAPVWRSDVGAGLLGLATGHGPADVARAVVEGVCLSERHVLSIAEAALGDEAASVRVAGRGVAGAPWRDARRDALERPLLLLDEPDVSALGAAMLGAMAAEGRDASGIDRLRSGTERIPAALGRSGFARYRAASAAVIRFADETDDALPDPLRG
jgi:xylulokinase